MIFFHFGHILEYFLYNSHKFLLKHMHKKNKNKVQKINNVFGKGLSMVQIYQSCLTYRINLQTLEDPFNSVVVVFVVRKSMFTRRSASL